jgi:hypothetical protein
MGDELIGVFTHIHGNITRILPGVIFFVFPLLFFFYKIEEYHSGTGPAWCVCGFGSTGRGEMAG